MNNDIIVIVADGNTQVSPLVAKAQGAGAPIGAVVVGTRQRAEEVAKSGVADVLWFEAGEGRAVEAYADQVACAIAEAGPRLVLASEGAGARTIAGLAAGKLKAALASSVISVRDERDSIVIERSIVEGKAVEVERLDGCAVALIADGGDFAEPCDACAPIEKAEVATDSVELVTTHEGEGGGASVASADRVVGMGRGFLSKDQIPMVQSLADALGAEIACSLSLCDDYRWFDHARVVGTSTQRISPLLYVAVGISGQPQHMSGVRAAKTIVAINKDPEAPIFKQCDFGIVGDLNDMVPALTAALQNA